MCHGVVDWFAMQLASKEASKAAYGWYRHGISQGTLGVHFPSGRKPITTPFSQRSSGVFCLVASLASTICLSAKQKHRISLHTAMTRSNDSVALSTVTIRLSPSRRAVSAH